MNLRSALTGVAFLFLLSALAAQAALVDLRAEWPKGDGLTSPTPSKTARFQLAGPGRIEVHLYLDPYRHAGKAAFVPLVWTRHPAPGQRAKGWGVMGAALEGAGHPDRFLQGGKEAKNWVEGAPWEMISTFDVAPGQYDLGVILSPPAIMYGSSWTQWQQNARLVITFGPKGSPSSGAGPSQSPVPGGDPAGIWTMQANGAGHTLEITHSGGGYAGRLQAGRVMGSGAAADTLQDLRFDAATGTLEFVRSLKAQGYPDQLFKGRLEGDKLAGEFGFAPNMGAKAGWNAARIGAPPSAPLAPPPGADLAGSWIGQAGGYGMTLEFTRGDSGYTARWLNAGAAAQTLTDVRFAAATGAVEFVRPLKAQGYPDQMFKGKLEGDKLAGEFGFTPNMGAKAGWSTVRKK